MKKIKLTKNQLIREIQEGINCILDNWDYWTDTQKKQHLESLSTIAGENQLKNRR